MCVCTGRGGEGWGGGKLVGDGGKLVGGGVCGEGASTQAHLQ